MFPINTDHRDYLAFRLAAQLPFILPAGLSDIISLQPALHFFFYKPTYCRGQHSSLSQNCRVVQTHYQISENIS